MKLLKYIIPVTLVSLFAFASCDSDLDKVTYHEGDAKVGSLNTIASSYVLDDKKADDVAETFKWTESTFGYDAAIIYRLEVDLAGENFANKRVISSVNGKTEAVVTHKELNEVILGLDSIYDIPPRTEATYDIRISATIGDVVTPVYTNVVTTNITTYLSYPKNMYMIGKDFGNWNWGNAGVAEMVPVHSTDGVFWCIRYFTAANGFKWCEVKEWKGDFFELDSKEGYTTKDGNAFVAADGFYIVYMDMPNKKITIKTAEVYGMGDTFGGWNTASYPFTASGKKMTITTTAAGELRMYAGYPAVGGDWWKMEFIILDGKIVYRAKGDDQERVNVTAGQKVTLDFNAGTGTIE